MSSAAGHRLRWRSTPSHRGPTSLGCPPRIPTGCEWRGTPSHAAPPPHTTPPDHPEESQNTAMRTPPPPPDQLLWPQHAQAPRSGLTTPTATTPDWEYFLGHAEVRRHGPIGSSNQNTRKRGGEANPPAAPTKHAAATNPGQTTARPPRHHPLPLATSPDQLTNKKKPGALKIITWTNSRPVYTQRTFYKPSCRKILHLDSASHQVTPYVFQALTVDR